MTSPELGFTVVSAAANIVMVGRFLGARVLGWYRNRRDRDIERAFIHDMASNHLPHIFKALRLITDKLGIEWQEPTIEFVTFKED